MKSGYICVFTHPSNPNLYKIGSTTVKPEKLLARLNSNNKGYAGQIVKDTNQKWELKEYHAVADPNWAKSVFWGNTQFADIPFRGSSDIEQMDWNEVQTALEAAKKAGVRPGPPPLEDYVYAYTASIRNRLKGRGITLIGHVRSMVSGKSDFQCDNGHKWRTTPILVGEGQGCPECGMGEQDPKEILAKIQAGAICLLTHPDKEGFVNIKVEYASPEDDYEGNRGMNSDGWVVHRFRNVEEVSLAESIAWKLLGKPLPHNRTPIKMNLSEAEDAFRSLIYKVREEIALREKAKEVTENSTS